MNTGIYDDAMPKRCGSEKPTPCGGCALRAEEGDQVTQIIMCVRKSNSRKRVFQPKITNK